MAPSPVCSLFERLSLAVLAVAFCHSAAVARCFHAKPLGTVEEAKHARVHGDSASSGTAVYAGDAVQTDSQGAVRVRVGKGRLYLSASSSASVEKRAGLATVTLAKGSATFSLPDPTEFELETPAGILRGSGTKATRGQVTITGTNEIVVSATEGALVLDDNGEFYTIAQGKAYRIVVTVPKSSKGSISSDSQTAERQKHKLLFFPVHATNIV
jgi:hypothetical protein